MADGTARKRMTVTEESQVLFFKAYLQKYEMSAKRSKRMTSARYSAEERRLEPNAFETCCF